ncbi:hypothetical protein GOP47_0013551 [Adiantum capillus-veneris]|uniref:Uncharacterized protein n=1 Tax=Adiantum capillus-veneris TaxID=13818 RepID=A0A9D4UNZ4_ADICA|nr:hypothetical protein GOP47_0013551 [Adiantum capillus-veneris]
MVACVLAFSPTKNCCNQAQLRHLRNLVEKQPWGGKAAIAPSTQSETLRPIVTIAPSSRGAPTRGAPACIGEMPTAIMFGGNKVIPASTTMFMDTEPEILEEGLMICTPTNRPASSSIISSKPDSKPEAHVKQSRPILMEQETAPISVFSVEAVACAPFVPSMTMMSTAVKGIQTVMSTASNTFWEDQHRVLSDSEGQFKSSQVSPLPCTNYDYGTVTRTYRLRDFCQLPAPSGADDAHSSCKYVNSNHGNENLCRKDRSNCNEPQTAVHPGKLPNWSRVVKPEVAFLDLEESWPPLTKKEDKFNMLGYAAKPIISAESQCENVIFSASYPNLADKFRPNTVPLHGSREVVLDEHCWPSLEGLNKLGHDYIGTSRKRALQPLSPANTSIAQQQRRKAHGSLYKTQNMHFPPILLMVNKDFIVTSPLKENLLLTLALMGRQSTANVPENEHAQCLDETGTRRQVLVGQFKAFSSFLHFMLGHDATRVRTESNAGGTSTISESLSVEYFVRRFQAKEIVTEMEVEYCSFNWKKVDYICTLYGQRVGISVTRAMSFPDPKDFSAQMAYRLLHKKLFGLVVARHGVSKRHSFSQCILHVWCETQQTADLMQREYDAVSRELDIADDVVMVLTVADGYHARPIFYETLLRNELK